MNANKSHLTLFKVSINIVLTLLSGTAIHKYFGLPVKDLFSFILYPILFYIFSRARREFNTRLGIISLITSLLLILTQIYGGWIEWLFTQTTIPDDFWIYFDIGLISTGLFFPVYLFIYKVLQKCECFTVSSVNKQIKARKKVFIGSFIFILLCWIPLYILAYPGIITPDSLAQIQIINGDSVLSDHHPIIHTALIGIFYKLGYFLFESHNGAVGIAILIQMIWMSLIFAYSISFLYSQKVKSPYLIGIAIFYGLSPIHAFYNITLWKDVLFSGVTLLLVIALYKLVIQKQNSQLLMKDLVFLSLTATGFVLLRNNGVYAYIFLLVFFVFFFRQHIRKVLPCSLLPLVIYIVVKGPVFSMLDVKSGHIVESLSIPLQQMGYLANHQELLTEEDKDLLNEIAPVGLMGERYLPYLSDPIKNLIRDNPDYPSLVDDKVEFIKTWAQLGLRYPRAYIRAYAYQTLGYWYMDVDYWVILDEIVPNEYGISRQSNEKIEDISKWLEELKDETPFISALWSVGLVCITTFGLIIIVITRREYELLTVFSVSVGIWITIMISTPVNAEFRYIYALYTVLPFLMIVPFIKQEKIK
ncbi:DUF6020 family protein [Turicibacter sanguinis]|uniref:DUF6020 family protein n=1 Tax=Turicibacter sanguinis TaxID=154288 RepID=UPI0018AAA707|nr:DUF6020 family protein [Turicibacter sanguinis]MDB8558558.1 DUF6020 family protein [Turicibacter sanguinis]MDB8561354.1 DUF6020 family protein [Turicibacter sanguinis]